jgi:hypothetical protein
MRNVVLVKSVLCNLALIDVLKSLSRVKYEVWLNSVNMKCG